MNLEEGGYWRTSCVGSALSASGCTLGWSLDPQIEQHYKRQAASESVRNKGRIEERSLKENQRKKKEKRKSNSRLSCSRVTRESSSCKLELNIDRGSVQCNGCEKTFYLRFWGGVWKIWKDGGVRGRGLAGSDCGDSQCKGTRTHVRHRGIKI